SDLRVARQDAAAVLGRPSTPPSFRARPGVVTVHRSLMTLGDRNVARVVGWARRQVTTTPPGALRASMVAACCARAGADAPQTIVRATRALASLLLMMAFLLRHGEGSLALMADSGQPPFTRPRQPRRPGQCGSRPCRR